MAAARLSLARASHGLVAALALIGMALGHAGIAASHPEADALWIWVRFWSFFTNVANASVVVCGIGCALPGGTLHRWAKRPGVRTGIAVYILIVGVIFRLLLEGLLPLGTLGWWSNLLVHQIVPIGWLGCWMAFGPHGGIGPRAPWVWLILPLVYAVWTIVHGLADGWYPYPFVDANKLGWPATLRDMAGFTVLFAGLSWLFRWIDARLARRTAVPARAGT